MPSTTQLIATAKAIINGTTLTRFNSIRLNQRFDNHHTFELSLSPDMLPDRPATVRINELAEKFVGESITIKLQQGLLNAGVVGAQQEQTFVGIVTAVRLTKTQNSTSAVLISGSSPTVLLNGNPTTRSFTELTLSDIVRKITGSVGLNSQVGPSNDVTIPYVTQYEEDNYYFLQRLAEAYGEWAYYDGNCFVFGKNGRVAGPALTLVNGRNLSDMEYSLRVTPFNFKATYYDYLSNTLLNVSSPGETVSGLQSYAKLALDKSEKLYKDKLTELRHQNHHTNTTLRESVKLKKSGQTNTLAVLQGRTPEMQLKVGGTVKVTDEVYGVASTQRGAALQETIDYGEFLITQLNHYLDARGIYQATFEGIPQDVAFPPVDYRISAPNAEPQPAGVKDTNDPEQLGRVKVQFAWQYEDNETTPWIRVANAMSSKEQGVYFVPEVGEVVFVDFEFGNPDLPFVTGSMYVGDKGPGPLFSPENTIKGIITKSGNHIIIDDESGKESIKIYNKDKRNSIELSLDGTHITIKSDGNLNLQAGGDINMKAGGDIKVATKKNLDVSATNMIQLLTDTGDIALVSAKALKLFANTELIGNGATVEVTASTKASIKANAQLELESSGPASLKGAVVRIN